jgi:hypothetical protein
VHVAAELGCCLLGENLGIFPVGDEFYDLFDGRRSVITNRAGLTVVRLRRSRS